MNDGLTVFYTAWKIRIKRLKEQKSPGRVAQLVEALYQCPRLVGSIPGQGTYKTQPMNARKVEWGINVSLSLLNQQIFKNKLKVQRRDLWLI